MDKVKAFLSVLKKYHFWMLALVVTVVGLGTWFSASAKLVDEYETNVSTIEGKITGLRGVVKNDPHPNEETIEQIKKETDQLRQDVASFWEELYASQAESVLTWPAILKQDFLDRIESVPFGGTIPRPLRERYRDKILEQFQTLPGIIGAEVVEPGEDSGSSSIAGLPGETADFGPRPSSDSDSDDEDVISDYLVRWADQGTIASKYVWERAPSSLRVWIVQEDLWIYETLLGVVRNTNKLATGTHDVTISEITALEIGQAAVPGAAARGRILRFSASGAEPGAEEAADPALEGGDPYAAASGGEFLEAGGGPTPEAGAMEAIELTSRRYLSAEGLPIAAEEGLVMPPGEFKRVPIRMVLVMDPTQIPRLLHHFAEAPLPVEVTQVRINADDASGGTSLSEFGGGPESGLAAGGDDEAEQPLYRVPVIVQGILYIVNPVDRVKLGLAEPTEEDAAVDPAAAAEAAEQEAAADAAAEAAAGGGDDAAGDADAPDEGAGEGPADDGDAAAEGDVGTEPADGGPDVASPDGDVPDGAGPDGAGPDGAGPDGAGAGDAAAGAGVGDAAATDE